MKRPTWTSEREKNKGTVELCQRGSLCCAHPSLAQGSCRSRPNLLAKILFMSVTLWSAGNDVQLMGSRSACLLWELSCVGNWCCRALQSSGCSVVSPQPCVGTGAGPGACLSWPLPTDYLAGIAGTTGTFRGWDCAILKKSPLKG